MGSRRSFFAGDEEGSVSLWEKDIFRYGLWVGKRSGFPSWWGGLGWVSLWGTKIFFLEWKRRALRPICTVDLQRKSGRIYCIDRNEERIISKKLRKRVGENERESELETFQWTLYGER